MTRWSSTYEMVTRYTELKPFLDTNDIDMIPLLLSPAQEQKLNKLIQCLNDFESVSKNLQEENLNMMKARILLNSLISRYGNDLCSYIGESAPVIANPEFENAIVKTSKGQLDLTSEEKDCISIFKNTNEITEESDDFAERALSMSLVEQNASHQSLKFVKPTSNIFERFFSRAKFILGQHRYVITPEHFESQLFLQANRQFWDIKTVQELIA